MYLRTVTKYLYFVTWHLWLSAYIRCTSAVMAPPKQETTTPLHWEMKSAFPGADRLNQYCVNLFSKGLNVTDVHLHVIDPHSSFNNGSNGYLYAKEVWYELSPDSAVPLSSTELFCSFSFFTAHNFTVWAHRSHPFQQQATGFNEKVVRYLSSIKQQLDKVGEPAGEDNGALSSKEPDIYLRSR